MVLAVNFLPPSAPHRCTIQLISEIQQRERIQRPRSNTPTINGQQPHQCGCLTATASRRMAAQTVKERCGGIAAAVSGGETPASGALLSKMTNDKQQSKHRHNSAEAKWQKGRCSAEAMRWLMLQQLACSRFQNSVTVAQRNGGRTSQQCSLIFYLQATINR